jgi:K+-sensing histidine kinase KdpD
LASNEIAKELLLEANQALHEEQLINLYFKIISVVIAVVLSIVLAFYLRAHNLLKRANIQRQWFITALSHDLRSPLAQIARSIDQGSDATATKKLLVQLEYLLNDTLEMAIDTQVKRSNHFEDLTCLK